MERFTHDDKKYPRYRIIGLGRCKTCKKSRSAFILQKKRDVSLDFKVSNYYHPFQLFSYHGEYPFFSENNLRGFFDMNIDSVDNNDLYISTNTNDILHANCIGSKPNPFSYKGDEFGK